MRTVFRMSYLLLFLLIGNSLLAQNLLDEFRSKMDFIFQHVDRNRVETGILSDYGYLPVNPNGFNGIPSDTNYVNMDIWKYLYVGMHASQFNAKAKLESPTTFFKKVDASNSLAILHLKYNKLDENAVNKGLLKVIDEQIIELQHTVSPYLEKELFAVSPQSFRFETNEVSFTFSKSLYITNTGKDIQQLEINFDNESGYRSASWGFPISYSFHKGGEKTIWFRISFSDGTVLTSRSKIEVGNPVRKNVAPSDIYVDEIPKVASVHLGGKIQYAYANFNKTGSFMRPLIIVEDADIKLFNKGKNVDLSTLMTDSSFKNAIDNLRKTFDIIYIDYNDGRDSIFKNAKFLEEAIDRINSQKNVLSDGNYVIGIGMGGLVAKYGLSDMEKRGKNHKVNKLITINTPHKGANFPVGFQAALRYGYNFDTSLSMGQTSISSMIELLDSDAMKEMLTFHLDKDYNLTNYHAEFMQEYEAMGMPTKCKTVAISTGSSHGDSLFPIGSTIFEYNSDYDPLNRIQHFIFNFFFFSTVNANVRITSKALSNQNGIEFFEGKVRVHKQILGIIHSWETQYDVRLESTPEMFAIDSAPGSYFDFKGSLGEEVKQNTFCFVPSVSALAVGDWKTKLYSDFGNLDAEKSGFDELYSTEGNNDYTELTACKDFLLQELAPRIEGDAKGISGQRTFTIYNVPAGVPLTWKFSNDNFKVVSQSGSTVTVTPLKFNCSSELQASINFPIGGKFVSIALASLPVSSMKIEFQLAPTYISSLKNRYEVYRIPENTTLSWRCSEGLIIEEQKDKYAIVYAKGKVVNPWVEAVITTVYGTETAIRKELKCVPLTGASLQLLKIWIGKNEKGEYCKKYAYQLVYEPAEIPVGQLSFCWSSSVEASKESSGGIQLLFPKKATILTEGNVASSFYSACFMDSLRVIGPPLDPINPLFPNGLVSMTSNSALPGIDPDLSVPYAWAHSVNYATVLMPQINLEQESKGRLYCTVRDYLGNSISAVSSEELWDKWQYEYHVAPNPVSTTLTVSKTSTNNGAIATYASSSVSEMLTLNLYNDFGLMRSMEADSSQSDIQMNVADLPNGTYYLNILKNGEVIDRQVVMIKH